MRVPFAKTEAHGNDFLLVEESVVGVEARASLARAICDRLRGIGADGLLFYRAVEGDFGKETVLGNGYARTFEFHPMRQRLAVAGALLAAAALVRRAGKT